MKILYVINQLDCGGAERQLVTLCEGLRKFGYELKVISIYDRLDLGSRLEAVQVPVTVAHKYAKLDLTVVWRLLHLIKKSNPDLIHTYLPASCLFTGMTKWLGVNAPIVQSERSVNTWRPRWRVWLDNTVRREVAAITCNAEAIRKHLIEKEHVPAYRIVLIHNGLAIQRRTRPHHEAIESARKQINASPGSFIVICVANFVIEKQHQVLLKAFAQAKKREKKLFLVLVGKGELEQNVRNWIDELNLLETSRLITDSTDPLPLLCASNIAILTSSVEGCSNALLEAMAMGLPIIASDAGGNRELVVDGRGGFISPVGDVRSFTNNLLRLTQNPLLSQAMGLYNGARVRREYTEEVMVEKTVSLYEKVMGKVARTPRCYNAVSKKISDVEL